MRLNTSTQGQTSQKKGKKPNVEIKKLGTDKVAGQTTRHIQVIDKDEGQTADLWLSDRYPAKLWTTVFSFGGDEHKSPSGQWTKIVEKEYGFKPEFALPPGYEVVDVPDMTGGVPSMKMPTTEEEAEKMREEWMKKMQQQHR